MRKQFNDGSIYDIAIPLVIFNYPQEVAPASIDFEGKDMTKIAEETKELANLKANELLSNKTFTEKFKGYTPILTKAMTLHRHP